MPIKAPVGRDALPGYTTAPSIRFGGCSVPPLSRTSRALTKQEDYKHSSEAPSSATNLPRAA
jgi:hypothetical protein